LCSVIDSTFHSLMYS